eukprot:symbB.v1.2.016320.t2/scaffold1240.1/size129799/3
MRLHYVRDYLSKVPDDVHADLAIQSDCAESGSCKRPPGQNHSWRRSGMGPIQDGRAVSGAAGCLEAVAVAYAAMADALQCYLRRPESHVMHHFVDFAVRQAQRGALRAFGRGPTAFNGMIRSRWSLLTFLSRLNPGRLKASHFAAPVVVSWSSREAELGGTNWAKRFAEEVFGDRPGIELEEDVDCAGLEAIMSPQALRDWKIFSLSERLPHAPETDSFNELHQLQLLIESHETPKEESALEASLGEAGAGSEGRSSPRPWEPARVRKLKMAYGVLGIVPVPSPKRGPPEDRVSRPASRLASPAPSPAPAMASPGRGLLAHPARPATAGNPHNQRPWAPTGSTRPEPVPNFGRYLPPTKELLEAFSGGLTCNTKVTPSPTFVPCASSCTTRLSRPTRPFSAPGVSFRRRSRKQSHRPGSPRPLPPWPRIKIQPSRSLTWHFCHFWGQFPMRFHGVAQLCFLFQVVQVVQATCVDGETEVCEDDLALSLRQLRGVKGQAWSFTNPNPELLVWDRGVKTAMNTTSGLLNISIYNGWLKVPLVHDRALMDYEMPPYVCLRVRGMAALKQPAKNGPLLAHCGGPGSGRDCAMVMSRLNFDIDGQHSVGYIWSLPFQSIRSCSQALSNHVLQ